jgi:hypothetical protein
MKKGVLESLNMKKISILQKSNWKIQCHRQNSVPLINLPALPEGRESLAPKLVVTV